VGLADKIVSQNSPRPSTRWTSTRDRLWFDLSRGTACGVLARRSRTGGCWPPRRRSGVGHRPSV